MGELRKYKMATLYFFESRLKPGTWCATTESNVKTWADEGYKVKKVVYESMAAEPTKEEWMALKRNVK